MTNLTVEITGDIEILRPLMALAEECGALVSVADSAQLRGSSALAVRPKRKYTPRRPIERHFQVGDIVQIKWKTDDVARKEVGQVIGVEIHGETRASYLVRFFDGSTATLGHSRLVLVKAVKP